MIHSGRVELLDLPRLAGQLTGLERRISRSGREQVDAFGGHEDLANSAAGALVEASAQDAIPLVAPIGIERLSEWWADDMRRGWPTF